MQLHIPLVMYMSIPYIKQQEYHQNMNLYYQYRKQMPNQFQQYNQYLIFFMQNYINDIQYRRNFLVELILIVNHVLNNSLYFQIIHFYSLLQYILILNNLFKLQLMQKFPEYNQNHYIQCNLWQNQIHLLYSLDHYKYQMQQNKYNLVENNLLIHKFHLINIY